VAAQPLPLPLQRQTYWVAGTLPQTSVAPLGWGGQCSATDGTVIPGVRAQALYALPMPNAYGSVNISTCWPGTNFDTMASHG
jgi:hypothetical protein